MRLPAFLSTLLIVAVAAFAADARPLPAISQINITIGPALQAKADDYGAREFEYLKADLRRAVERELAKGGAVSPSGGVLDLVIEDAKPNRPTFEQMVDRPGLSFESRSIGGAEVSGTLTLPDGSEIPLRYGWFETDFRNTLGSATWSDAERAFDRFARGLLRGDIVERPD